METMPPAPLTRAAHSTVWPALAITAFQCLAACGGPSPWRVARQLDTVEAYDAYLAEKPEGEFVGEALERIERMLRGAALEGDVRQDCEIYLVRFPDSEHRLAVEEQIAALDWSDAAADGSQGALERFLDRHPVSSHTPAALEGIQAIEERERVRVQQEARRVFESEATAAFDRIQESQSLEEWETFVVRFHDTPLGPYATARVESLADPTIYDEFERRAADYRTEVEAEGRQVMVCARLVLVEQAAKPVALLVKRSDRTYASTEDRGIAASDAAARQALLRRTRPGAFHVIQVTREALFGDHRDLERAFISAASRCSEMQGVSWFESSFLTLGSPAELWPDPDPMAPGGLGLEGVTEQHRFLTMAFGPKELASVLHRLSSEVGSWARDRSLHAGWTPRTPAERALLAVLDDDLETAKQLGSEAEAAALEVWLHGHSDVRSHGEDMLRALDPGGAEERFAWMATESGDTLAHYNDYLESFGNGPNAGTARARRSAILSDDAPYVEAIASGNLWVLGGFVHDYPGHFREAEARAILEGTDLFTLIENREIQVEIQGKGIKKLLVKARPLVASPVSVRVPVGTIFVSADRRVQNMVTRESTVTWLQPFVWQELEIKVACANIERNTPGQRSRFSVQRHPASEDLEATLSVLEAESPPASFDVVQAATWILTDDADYEGLGELRTRSVQNPFGRGSRSINRGDALRAMRAIHKAGVDLTTRKIWQDRAELTEGVDDAALTDWMSDRVHVDD